MNITDFKNNLSLYGADLSRWPQADIKPALTLIEQDATASALFKAEENLDAHLRHYTPAPSDLASLANAIAVATKNLPQHDRKVTQHAPVLGFLARGSGLMVAGILGFLISFNSTANADNYLLDPAFYTQEQIINDGNDAIYEGEIL